MEFPTALSHFLHYCAVERRLSEHTLSAYKFDLIDFRRWMPVGKTHGEIGEEDLKLYLEDMVSIRRLSPATVRRRIACLRAFYRRLADLGATANPFDGWRLKLPRRRRLPRALVRSEVITLLHPSSRKRFSARDTHMEAAFRLMVATGLRVGELCSIRLPDISQDCSVVRIHGKGSRDRVAYVTDPGLRKALKEIVETRRSEQGPGGALLVNRIGNPMRPQSVRSRLRRRAAEAGVQRRVTPHMLRHTAATLLIETGVDIRFVQRLLGHSSIATTEIYTHVTDEALRATLEKANVLGLFGTADAGRHPPERRHRTGRVRPAAALPD